MRLKLISRELAFQMLAATLSVAAVEGARVLGVEVPDEVGDGEDVSLRCLVEPWPRPLYSLSWWKDGAQFYRSAMVSTPARHNQNAVGTTNNPTIFPLPGLTVKRGLGGLGHVVLKKVSVAASGTYTCEAVEDFPFFSQTFASSNLTVVDTPDTWPIISGFRNGYYPGEVLATNCTVLRAYPTPAVFWLINDLQVQKGVKEVLKVQTEVDLTLTLTARLTLRVGRQHFTNGTLNLTCVAKVGGRYTGSTYMIAHRRSTPPNARPNPATDRHSDKLRSYHSLHSRGSSISMSWSEKRVWAVLRVAFLLIVQL